MVDGAGWGGGLGGFQRRGTSRMDERELSLEEK